MPLSPPLGAGAAGAPTLLAARGCLEITAEDAREHWKAAGLLWSSTQAADQPWQTNCTLSAFEMRAEKWLERALQSWEDAWRLKVPLSLREPGAFGCLAVFIRMTACFHLAAALTPC